MRIAARGSSGERTPSLCGGYERDGCAVSNIGAGADTYQTGAHKLENLGEGVRTPDIYVPTLNRLYRDVLARYGVVAPPCRVGDPDRKGPVNDKGGARRSAPPLSTELRLVS